MTAKTVATLDHLLGAGLLFGVGAGRNIEEVANHCIDPRDLFGVPDERVEAMRRIWTTDVASYDGRFVSFGSVWSWPKPGSARTRPFCWAPNRTGSFNHSSRGWPDA